MGSFRGAAESPLAICENSSIEGALIGLQRRTNFVLGGDASNSQCAGCDFHGKRGKRQKRGKDPMVPELQGFYEPTENNPAVKTRGRDLCSPVL